MPKLLEQLTTDFSFGMVDSAAPTAYPSGSVGLIVNGRSEPDGTVSRRSGTIKTHPDALEADTGYGAVLFTTAAGADQLVAIFGAKAYRSLDSGATWTEIATGLREDYYSFATMRVGATNYLFCANGDTTIKRWDGTTWDTVPNAPSGVKYIAVFNSRLWGAGHSGVIAQGSKISDPTTWTTPDGVLVQAQTHSGDVPTGMYQIGTHLLVFDRSATSYIDGFGEQTIIVATGATGFSRSVGCIGHRTVVAVGDNAVCWLSRRGVEYYTIGGKIELVSKQVQRFMNRIDWDEVYNNPGRASGAYDEIRQDYHLALSINGIRNDRVLVLNLRGSIQYQRGGPRSAAAIDRLLSPDSGDVLFGGGDADGYLTDAVGGSEASADASGYMSLADAGESGDPVSEDADGYLDTVTNDTLPASLFVAPTAGRVGAVYSQGYDGYVRLHYGVASDDMDSDETGGTAVALTLRSKPFLYKRPKQRKKARRIHVASIQTSPATLTVLTVGPGKTSVEKTVSMPEGGEEQATRKRASTLLVADSPQVEIRTEDDVRLSLVGLSSELMREPT